MKIRLRKKSGLRLPLGPISDFLQGPSPPAADDPYQVEKPRRRLPHYYYRRLPSYFYPARLSTVGVVASVGLAWRGPKVQGSNHVWRPRSKTMTRPRSEMVRCLGAGEGASRLKLAAVFGDGPLGKLENGGSFSELATDWLSIDAASQYELHDLHFFPAGNILAFSNSLFFSPSFL